MLFSGQKLFQVGVICGFIDKVYEGDYSLGQLAQKGNLGIGTFDQVHGELIGFDGKFYRIIEDGVARQVDPNIKTPFAWVINFEETQQIELKNIQSFEHFSTEFDKKIESSNYIYSYRFNCPANEVRCRSEACQPQPSQPLIETLPQLQRNFIHHQINGVFVGFRFPEYFSAFNVPGHHIHYLDLDHMRGGHVFELNFNSATVSICCIKNYEVALIESAAFQQVKINPENLAQAIHAIEKKKN